MKKISIILVVFCSVLVPSGRADDIPRTVLGIRAGVNLSKPSFNNNLFQTSNFTGFQVGPIVNTWIAVFPGLLEDNNISGTVGISAAVLYNHQGVQFKFDNTNFKKSQSALEIPVYLKFPIPVYVWGFTFFCLNAGPYVSFKLNGNDFSVIQDDIDFKSKSFGAGINLGVSFELATIASLSANYKIGLTDDYKSLGLGTGNLDIRGRTRMWSITLTLPLLPLN